MTLRDPLLESLFDRAGIACLSTDNELRIVDASPGVERFCRRRAREIEGSALTETFAEFAGYYPRLRQLARGEPGPPVRFRLRHGDNLYAMVSAAPVSAGDARVLVLFEDITLLVLRTDVLGQRVKDLESRCQYLERLIAGHRDAVGAGGYQRHFDPGSGLYSLDYIITRLVDEEALARRWHRPLSVAVLRLQALARRRRDGALTDEGLEAAVRECAGIIRRGLRSMDTVGRLDETAVVAVLPNVDRDDARVPIDRIRGLLAGRPLVGDETADLPAAIAEFRPDAGDTALAVFERARQDI